jgi:hypothetical protein
VIPETDLERELFETAPERQAKRNERKYVSRNLAEKFGVGKPWLRT